MPSGQTSEQGTMFLVGGEALTRTVGESGMCPGSYKSSDARPQECREKVKVSSEGVSSGRPWTPCLGVSVLSSRQTETFQGEKDTARHVRHQR